MGFRCLFDNLCLLSGGLSPLAFIFILDTFCSYPLTCFLFGVIFCHCFFASFTLFIGSTINLRSLENFLVEFFGTHSSWNLDSLHEGCLVDINSQVLKGAFFSTSARSREKNVPFFMVGLFLIVPTEPEGLGAPALGGVLQNMLGVTLLN